jgi:Leucine-rich repeat (LRR) protein
VASFQHLERLEKLEVLCVNENKVRDFPPEVCHLWNLKELNFCDN